MNKQIERSSKKAIKEYFSVNKPLHGEMNLYKNLYELERADSYTAHFLIQESKKEYNTLNKKEIFNEQTKLINWINQHQNSKKQHSLHLFLVIMGMFFWGFKTMELLSLIT